MSIPSSLPSSTHALVLNTAEGHLQMAIGRLLPDASAYELLCAQEWRIVSQGAEMLTPLLLSTLERLHLTLNDISQIACVSGPGSFTGIRLAITTAAGLARARRGKIKQAGFLFMPLLARSAAVKAPFLLEQTSSVVWVLTHARRNLVHMQGFSSSSLVKKGGLAIDSVTSVTTLPNSATGSPAPAASGLVSVTSSPASMASGLVSATGRTGKGTPMPERTDSERGGARLAKESVAPVASGLVSAASSVAPTASRTETVDSMTTSVTFASELATAVTDILVLSLEEVAAYIHKQGDKAIMLGSGVNRNREALQALLPHAMLLPEAYATVEPVVLMEQCALCTFSDADIAPTYIRACDAEENLDAIANSLGLDVKQARATLATVTGA